MTLNKDKNDFPKQIDETGVGAVNPNHWRQEFTWLALILAAGLLPRLVFIRSFPAHPTSDFLNILDFAVLLKDDWFARNAWQWQYFSPGLPLIIAAILNFIHKSPETIGRWATAVSTGLVPVLPYIIWKDTFRMRTRIIAALLLALWPGQILFSSVLAQDNWIIFPTVALSALAVRVLVTKRGGNPVLAAVLYTATVAIRQEMMIALLPVTIIAALGARADKRARNLIVGSSVVGILFAVLVLQRGIATGRYALTTEHFGISILGAYIPGAGMGWISPIPYLDATHPELLEQDQLGNGLDRGALNLAWQEFLRRPKFHVFRIFGSAFTNLFEMDGQIIWWSLGAEGILPHQYRKAAFALETDLTPLLQIYPIVVNILFVSSIFFALGQRAILERISPIIAAIILKLGLHAVIVSQPRYFLIITALELLTFSIVTEVCFRTEHSRMSLRSLAAGVLSVLALSLLSTQARIYNLTHDELSQRTQRAFLQVKAGELKSTTKQDQWY